MDEAGLITKLENFCGARLHYDEENGLHLFQGAHNEVLLATCLQSQEAAEHLAIFEQAIQSLINARRKSESFEAFIVLDVEAIERRETPSYRAALKKYSSSVIFEDLQIGLILIGARIVHEVQPEDVNSYLRNLDKNLNPN